MYAHANKVTTDNQSEDKRRFQKDHAESSAFQFPDNRPESMIQAKLQVAANNSPQEKKMVQFQEIADHYTQQQKVPVQKKENNTGLPDNLKSGIENLSGYSLDDVKVHYNSDKPAQLQAHAYAQGTDIHISSGQEKHLAHEAWHVVQQKQGRVKTTLQMKGGLNINDEIGLEQEADVMGEKAIQLAADSKSAANFQDDKFPESQVSYSNASLSNAVIQGVFVYSFPSHSIINTDKDDKYYEGINFIRVINPFGGFVWADRRNVEYVKELLGHHPSMVDPEMTEIEAFTIQAPTHDKDWQYANRYDDRLACISEALDIIDSGYDPSKLYILSAPEYFLAAQNKSSHFMDKEDFEYVSAQLQSIASSLPPNLLMVPGTIGYSEIISGEDLEEEVENLKAKHTQLLKYVSSYKAAEETDENRALYGVESVKDDYKFDWDIEIESVEGKAKAKKLFNRALIFYNQTMEVYDKMFESVNGERDRGKGDDETLFEHGTKPFIGEYNGVKVALQICSDFAYESLRGLDTEPDIQLVPASNYGGAESFQQAKALLKADSKESSLTGMNENKKAAQEPNAVWQLNSSKGTTLSYHSVKK